MRTGEESDIRRLDVDTKGDVRGVNVELDCEGGKNGDDSADNGGVVLSG